MTALQLKASEIKKAGFDASLRKPVDPDILCGTVQKLGRGQTLEASREETVVECRSFNLAGRIDALWSPCDTALRGRWPGHLG